MGSEVHLGLGFLDILAVESSARPAIIEFKLASNSDARRAIVSQILAYAAALQGFEIKALEQGPLRQHLADTDCESILDIVKSQDQEGAVDEGFFDVALQDFLDQGRFRLVLVLDEVPAELEKVVAYMDAITEKALTIDLIVVKVYDANGVQVALPQRGSPDFSVVEPTTTTPGRGRPRPRGILSDGIDVFRASIEGIAGKDRDTFDELMAWAEQLAALPNVRVYTYDGGAGRITLLPRIISRNAGLVTIWNDNRRTLHIHVAFGVRSARTQIQSSPLKV